MTKLKELSIIIASLKEDEVKSLQRYIHCFEASGENREQKSERLLNLLIQNNQFELRSFESKFSKHAFSMHVLRLYDKVLEVLTLDMNIRKPEIYNEVATAKLFVRKRLMSTIALGTKNHILETIAIYQKCVVTCKEFELYDELLICMHELMNLYAALSRHAEFEALEKEIQHYEEIRVQVKRAYHIYNKYTMERVLYPEDKRLETELEHLLPSLKSYYLISQSAQVGWFYYRLLVEFHNDKQNLVEGYNACNALLKLQLESPSIRTNRYLAMTHRELANISMHLYNFDESLLSILKAQNMERDIKRNMDITKEKEFFVYFYKGEISDARYIVNDLYDKTNVEESKFQQSRYSYYKAACAFINGTFREVSQLLGETREVEKDKEGWNIAVRILSILNQIETQEFDLADSRIESMRKYIERTLKEKDIRPRFILVLRLLRDLVNSSFNYEQIWQTRQSLFSLLMDDSDNTHRWKIMTPELIRFDVWFEAKATGKSYTQVFAARMEASRERIKQSFSKAV